MFGGTKGLMSEEASKIETDDDKISPYNLIKNYSFNRSLSGKWCLNRFWKGWVSFTLSILLSSYTSPSPSPHRTLYIYIYIYIYKSSCSSLPPFPNMSRPAVRGAPGKQISFDCLLPTGLMLTVTVGSNDKFEDVKRELWAQASKMPLFNILKVCICRRCVGE